MLAIGREREDWVLWCGMLAARRRRAYFRVLGR